MNYDFIPWHYKNRHPLKWPFRRPTSDRSGSGGAHCWQNVPSLTRQAQKSRLIGHWAAQWATVTHRATAVASAHWATAVASVAHWATAVASVAHWATATTYVGVVVPRVPATSTPFPGLGVVIHVWVAETVSVRCKGEAVCRIVSINMRELTWVLDHFVMMLLERGAKIENCCLLTRLRCLHILLRSLHTERAGPEKKQCFHETQCQIFMQSSCGVDSRPRNHHTRQTLGTNSHEEISVR